MGSLKHGEMKGCGTGHIGSGGCGAGTLLARRGQWCKKQREALPCLPSFFPFFPTHCFKPSLFLCRPDPLFSSFHLFFLLGLSFPSALEDIFPTTTHCAFPSHFCSHRYFHHCSHTGPSGPPHSLTQSSDEPFCGPVL